MALQDLWESAVTLDDLSAYSLIYLGSPYSKYPHGIEAAFRDVAKLTAKLLVRGLKIYSPITHTHPIAIYGGLDPFEHEIWLPFDTAIIQVCQAMLVAQMDGWRESYGIAEEIKMFSALSKPIYYLSVPEMALV